MKLSSVNALLEDAEEKQLKRSKVWEWLDELKDALYHAENLLDDNNTEALRHKLEEDSGTSRTSQVLNFSSAPIHELDKSLIPRILDSLDKLEVIINEKDVFNLQESVKHRPQRLW